MKITTQLFTTHQGSEFLERNQAALAGGKGRVDLDSAGVSQRKLPHKWATEVTIQSCNENHYTIMERKLLHNHATKITTQLWFPFSKPFV